MGSAGPGDDHARFLADLRALRDSAAIGYDELTARAHYPSDILKEAENGPSLPGLPILTAYVRACEGDVLDWEERWRHLASEVPDDPGLPVRPAGASPAAVAGARAGVSVAPPDVYDPERIRAALRGDQGRSGEVGRRNTGPGASAPTQGSAGGTGLEISDRGPGLDTGSGLDAGPRLNTGAGWGASSNWDTAADLTITSANGNHPAIMQRSREPFDASVAEMADRAEHTDTAQGDNFSWLSPSKPSSPPADGDFAWPDQAHTGLAPRQADTGPAPRQGDTGPAPRQGDTGPAPRQGDTGPAPRQGDTGPAPRQGDTGLAPPEPTVGERATRQLKGGLKLPPERTDFWATPVTAASADLQLSAAPPARAEEPTIRQASWPPAETRGTPDTPAITRLPQRAVPDLVPGIGSAAVQPGTSAESTGSVAAGATVFEPELDHQDRFFPVRLLAVIIIAALIGSGLVLLLK
jgi:hypothetical protein